jgi:very-short-patch-repair endonuclease
MKGKKQSLETREKRSKTMTGRKYDEERIRKSAMAKRMVIPEEIRQKIKKLLDFGMPDGYIFRLIKIDQTIYRRMKKEFFPDGIPWQIKYLEKDFPKATVEEIVKLTRLKYRYKRIARLLSISHKTVKRILTSLNKRDPTIKMHSFDSDCWSSTISSIEKKILNFLIEEGIPHEQQHALEIRQNMPFDFRILGINLLIEVNGDYYHCNPKVFPKPINEYQKWAMRRDFAKRNFANAQGYFLLTLWEQDINKNFEEVKEKIRKVIKKCQENQQELENL